MKYSVNNLLKRKNERIVFEDSLDFSDIASTNKDLRDLSLIDVKGEITIKHELAYVKMRIAGEMTLICAVSAEDVLYPFDIEVEEVFNLGIDKLQDDSINEVINKTVDIIPYIWQNIVVEIPIKIVKDGAQSLKSGEGWNLISEEKFVDLATSEEKEIDPRLKKLLDIKYED